MLSCHVRNERQPRSRNGQPAQSTTGVASSASTHCAQVAFIQCGSPALVAHRSTAAPGSNPGTSSPIANTSNGMVNASASQKRRVMSRNSGFSPTVTEGASGSSVIPQMGQLPGPTWRICGCIGHV